MKRVVSHRWLTIVFILLQVTAAAQNPGAELVSVALGQLHGLQWEDLNGNGIREAEEPGLADWQIHLSNGLTTYTNAEGLYAFTALVPGNYTLTSEARMGWFHTFPRSKGHTDPEFAWTHTMGETPVGEIDCFKVETTDLGDVYCLGSFTGLVDFDPGTTRDTHEGSNSGYLSKLNADGTYAWALSFGTQLRSGNFDMTLNSEGHILLAYQNRLEERDAQGTLLWQHTVQHMGPGYTRINRVCVDGDGHIFCAGVLSGEADFDPTATQDQLHTESAEISALFIMRIHRDRTYGWTLKTEGHPLQQGSMVNPHAMCTDASGNVFVAGSFIRGVDFDPGLEKDYQESAGDTDAFLMKITNMGDYAWTVSPGGADYDLAYDVCTDGEDAIYLAGTYSYRVAFGEWPHVVLWTDHAKIGAGFVAKYHGDKSLAWVRDFGEEGHYTAMTSLAPTSHGQLYTAGERMPLDSDEGSMSDLFVVRLDGHSAEESWRSELSALSATSGAWSENDFENPHHPFGWDLAISREGHLFLAGKKDAFFAFESSSVFKQFTQQEREQAFVMKSVVEPVGQTHTVNLLPGTTYFGLDFGAQFLQVDQALSEP